MKKAIVDLSNSLTASTSTQVLCMTVNHVDTNENKMYFVEYPTNLPPNHNNLYVRGNTVKELPLEDYNKVKEAFKSFEEHKQVHSYLHAPTYLIAYLAPYKELNLFS